MSAIVGIAGATAEDNRRLGEAALRAVPQFGDPADSQWLAAGPAWLGAIRHPWEPAISANPRSVASSGHVTVAADATLYYRADLCRRLGRGTPDAAAAELIALAWETRGSDCLPLLEGDFAFVLWDRRQHELVAVRGPNGMRTLHVAWHGDVLRVATDIASLLADDALPRDLDLATVATVAAGLWLHAPATGYRAVTELPAGHMLRWRPGTAPSTHRWWHPPPAGERTRAPLDAGAEELRSLLDAAVAERLAPTGRSVVTLSGGWDSSAVYATAQAVSRARGRPSDIQAVSISYPQGDPGREDELIALTTAHWGSQADFLDIADIPMFPAAAELARTRPHPFAHAYEHWNRALHRRAAALGARVVLDGVGGDQLFQVSDVLLAQLFRWGQWMELRRLWRARPASARSWTQFKRLVLARGLPPSVVRWWDRLQGGGIRSFHMQRRAAGWVRPEAVRALGIARREQDAVPPLPDDDLILAESHAYLTFPFYPRIFAALHGFALAEGTELRSPLLDDRVVRFALARPWTDRVDIGETKRSLRRAMAGRLPAEVLAPRPHRTGVTIAYFLRQMRSAGWALAEPLLQDSRLAELGIVDPARWREGWEALRQHDDGELAARLYFTLQAELWIRSRTP